VLHPGQSLKKERHKKKNNCNAGSHRPIDPCLRAGSASGSEGGGGKNLNLKGTSSLRLDEKEKDGAVGLTGALYIRLGTGGNHRWTLAADGKNLKNNLRMTIRRTGRVPEKGERRVVSSYHVG